MPDDRPGLAEAMKVFASANPMLATTDGARNQCISASSSFIDLLLERGVILPWPEDRWDWEVMEIDVIDGVSHYAARVGVTLIDWTARQFHQDEPWPKVWDDHDAKPR